MEKQKRRPGGGRKPLPKEMQKIYVSTSISGTPEEIQELKEIAREKEKSVSRLIFDNLKSLKE